MTKAPSLADWLHGWTYDTRPFFRKLLNLEGKVFNMIDRDGKKAFRDDLLRADRFVLSDDFLRRAIHRASSTDVKHLLSTADLARLPAKNVLVEYDDRIRYETQLELGTAIPVPPEHDLDDWERAGFLYLPHSGGWNAVHVSSSPSSIPVWPVTSWLRGDASAPLPHNFTDPKNKMALYFLASAWGVLKKDKSALGFAMHEELANRGYASFDPFFATSYSSVAREMDSMGEPEILKRFTDGMMGYAKENAGSLRLSTAILASLNTVPTKLVHRVPKLTFTHRLRNMKELSLSSVLIDAKPGHEVAVYDRAFRQATGRHNKRHEVRGHWRDVSHSGFHVTCAHEPADTDGDYALCGKCQRLLRWIEHHERGDEKLGWVLHTHYKVA